MGEPGSFLRALLFFLVMPFVVFAVMVLILMPFAYLMHPCLRPRWCDRIAEWLKRWG
jgi:hypothetical protein